MFGKSKKEITSSASTVAVQVTAIPAEFYGGRNPVVKFKNVEKEVAAKVSFQDKKPVVPVVAPPFSTTTTPTAALGNRRTVLFWSIGLFVIFLAGATGYYWWQATRIPAGMQPPVTPVNTSLPEPVGTSAVVPTTTIAVANITSTPTTTTPEAVSTTPSLSGGAIEFPSLLLGNSPDQDHDGLTDTEESLYKTDIILPDTDGDQYADATEVTNLYSPTVVAPTRIIDTDAVKDYQNSTFGYRMYYPASWAIGAVDTASQDVLFSSANGENVEVRVFDLPAKQSFDDWFALWAPSEHASSLRDFSSVFKLAGKSRSDNLVYYFVDESHVYLLLYHPVPGANTVSFRTVISMMARSFRLATTPNVLPVQPVVPESTTTPL